VGKGPQGYRRQREGRGEKSAENRGPHIAGLNYLIHLHETPKNALETRLKLHKGSAVFKVGRFVLKVRGKGGAKPEGTIRGVAKSPPREWRGGKGEGEL